MADRRSWWAERSAAIEHERAVASRARARFGERPRLVTISSLEEVEERRLFVCAGEDLDQAGHGQVLRAAVNDLQHRLLLMDPQQDVYALALERLMTAAGADRVCAFVHQTRTDGRDGFVLHAEAVVSPAWSLLRDAAAQTPEAYGDLIPGLCERLAAGEPFGSRTEFLPRGAAVLLAAQDVETTLFLPLFVGGLVRGFLRLDRCDGGRLWSEGETSILVSAAGSVSAAIERQQVVAKLVQRSHELSALLATSRSITSSIDYDVVLSEVACAAAEALSCPQSAIWECSPATELATYRVLYQRHPSPGVEESFHGSTLVMSDYPGGLEALRAGEVSHRTRSDRDLTPDERVRMTQWDMQTLLRVPLVYGGEVLGMMVLMEPEQERCFTVDELRMARVIGEQAAAALHNAQLHRSEADQHRWLAALAEATRVIASRLDRSELLHDVARLAADALLVHSVLVYEWDDRAVGFIPCAGAGTSLHAASTAPVIGSETAQALRRGEVIVRPCPVGDLITAATTLAHERTEVWVPFRMKDETLGAMRCGDSSPQRRFAPGELSFARALGEHAAIALNNARLYEQIEDQATRDGLTGLANHRRFYDRLAEAVDTARETGTAVSLLMIDIDDFKKLNDTHGHPAGDEVLRRIGRLMACELNDRNLVARYGGEEFCVILPGTDLLETTGAGAQTPEAAYVEGAATIAERLRQRVAASEFPIAPDGASVRVTVSIGAAAFPRTADGMDVLVARADAALYAAKRAGKDRVEIL